jgi:hypothetical protein
MTTVIALNRDGEIQRFRTLTDAKTAILVAFSLRYPFAVISK